MQVHIKFGITIWCLVFFMPIDMLAQQVDSVAATKTKTIGIHADAFLSVGLNGSPQFYYQSDQHTVFIGPRFELYQTAGAIDVLPYKAPFGILVGYRFYPFRKGRRQVNGFFQFDTQFAAYNSLDSVHTLSLVQQQVKDDKLTLFQNTLGYGLNIKLYRSLFFDTRFALGTSTYFFRDLELQQPVNRTYFSGILFLGFGVGLNK